MAEVVAEMQERLLPEYEQLKRYEVCTDEQIKDCMRKRESFQAKITQSHKSIRDYAEFIIYERKVHKWVTEKEALFGNKVIGLKTTIAQRIIRLYRDGLRQFPHEERFWQNFIQFSKKSVPHEVSGIYEKMLTFHGDKAELWRDAALWTYHYSKNMRKVKEIFFRGLQRHGKSEVINKAFFDVLLVEASRMSSKRNLANNTTSEQDIGMELVTAVYENCRKTISNISFFLYLLKRCEEEKYRNLTAPLQMAILEDLMEMFPREELLWDTLARRELHGLNMADLKNYGKKNDTAEPTDPTTTLLPVQKKETPSQDEPMEEKPTKLKDPMQTQVWSRRTLKRRIKLCANVYQTAVRTLKTPQMWSLYINAMLELNQDMSTQQVLKRKYLAAAFKGGHESGLMSEQHYCTFIRLLLSTPEKGTTIAEPIIEEAVRIHQSSSLYELWISMYIVTNNSSKVMEILRTAEKHLGEDSIQTWQHGLLYFKTLYDEKGAKGLLRLYKEGCRHLYLSFGRIRVDYLEFCIKNMSLQKTRSEYDQMTMFPPPCLELHQKMAQLESEIVGRTEADLKRWRLCHENATYFFGKGNTKVWIDFICFERNHGDPKRMTFLYNRAKDTLKPELVDNFISEYTLLAIVI